MEKENNHAYVDGQNLYLGTSKLEKNSWNIDLFRFRVYLEKKYNVTTAYYYLGYMQENEAAKKLYEEVQLAGFVLVFKQHKEGFLSKKKGNVDSDIIFSIMKKIYKKEKCRGIVLVSGDGDYKNVIDFLIAEKKFTKILFPNKRFSSSLYKSIRSRYFASLDDEDVKKKISKERDVL